MGRCTDITEEKKVEIKAFLQTGNLPKAEIARLVGVSRSVVSRIATKVRDNLATQSRRKGKCGRKRCTSKRQDIQIIRTVKNNRKTSVKLLNSSLAAAAGIYVSDRTLRRRFKERGFLARRPYRKPLLTPRMVKSRLLWAKMHKKWSQKDWNKVIFSDESTFVILDDKAQFVRRRPGEELDRNCIVETVKHPTSVMIWSCISSKGVGPLYIVEGTMRSDQYKKVLQTRLRPQIKKWFKKGEKFVFMQDGAPCHTAKIIKKYLNNVKIPLLPWPGNSPDMNPIENLWAIVKRRMASIRITTRAELINRLTDVWHHDPEIAEIARNCIESMPTRLKSLFQCKGQRTKY
jgi:transposase